MINIICLPLCYVCSWLSFDTLWHHPPQRTMIGKKAAFGVIEKCKKDVTVLSAYNIIYILDIATYQFYQHICIYIYVIYIYIYTYYQHFQIFLSLDLQCSKKLQKVTMKVAHNSCDPRYSHSYHICRSSSWWFFGGSYGQGWMGLAQVVEVALVNLAAKLNQQKKHTKNNQVGQFVFFLCWICISMK